MDSSQKEDETIKKEDINIRRSYGGNNHEEELPECANVPTTAMNYLKHVVLPVEIKNAWNVICSHAEQNRTLNSYAE